MDPGAFFFLDADDVTVRGGFLGLETTPLERPARGEAPTVLDGDVGGDDGAGLFLDNCDVALLVRGASPTLDRIDVVRTGVFGAGFVLLVTSGEFRLQECAVRDSRGNGVSVLPISTQAASVHLVDCVTERCFQRGFYFSGAGNLTRLRFEGCISRDNDFGFLVGPGWPRDTVIKNCVASGSRQHGVYFRAADSDDQGALIQGSTLTNNALGGVLYAPAGNTTSPGITVRNSILWGNGGPGAGALEQFEGEGVGPQLIFSSIVQGATPSGSLYAFDPLFVDAANGDYALQSASPAIDRGDGAIVDEGELDVVRRHRAVDIAAVPNLGPSSMDAVDIGAFEFSGAIGDNAGCAAELNSTGRAGRLFA
ncbi:MAG: right-handed parallel beta-helix repeat-containing protein, partial [Planctomycetota bacterium]